MTTRTTRRNTLRRYDWVLPLILFVTGAFMLYQVISTVRPVTPILGVPENAANFLERFFASPNTNGIAMLLFALGLMTLGASWLAARVLRWRFRLDFEPLKTWRQSLWVAIFVTIGAWLQLNRSLTLALAVLIAAALVSLEVYLNVRER